MIKSEPHIKYSPLSALYNVKIHKQGPQHKINRATLSNGNPGYRDPFYKSAEGDLSQRKQLKSFQIIDPGDTQPKLLNPRHSTHNGETVRGRRRRSVTPVWQNNAENNQEQVGYSASRMYSRQSHNRTRYRIPSPASSDVNAYNLCCTMGFQSATGFESSSVKDSYKMQEHYMNEGHRTKAIRPSKICNDRNLIVKKGHSQVGYYNSSMCINPMNERFLSYPPDKSDYETFIYPKKESKRVDNISPEAHLGLEKMYQSPLSLHMSRETRYGWQYRRPASLIKPSEFCKLDNVFLRDHIDEKGNNTTEVFEDSHGESLSEDLIFQRLYPVSHGSSTQSWRNSTYKAIEEGDSGSQHNDTENSPGKKRAGIMQMQNGTHEKDREFWEKWFTLRGWSTEVAEERHQEEGEMKEKNNVEEEGGWQKKKKNVRTKEDHVMNSAEESFEECESFIGLSYDKILDTSVKEDEAKETVTEDPTRTCLQGLKPKSKNIFLSRKCSVKVTFPEKNDFCTPESMTPHKSTEGRPARIAATMRSYLTLLQSPESSRLNRCEPVHSIVEDDFSEASRETASYKRVTYQRTNTNSPDALISTMDHKEKKMSTTSHRVQMKKIKRTRKKMNQVMENKEDSSHDTADACKESSALEKTYFLEDVYNALEQKEADEIMSNPTEDTFEKSHTPKFKNILDGSFLEETLTSHINHQGMITRNNSNPSECPGWVNPKESCQASSEESLSSSTKSKLNSHEPSCNFSIQHSTGEVSLGEKYSNILSRSSTEHFESQMKSSLSAERVNENLRTLTSLSDSENELSPAKVQQDCENVEQVILAMHPPENFQGWNLQNATFSDSSSIHGESDELKIKEWSSRFYVMSALEDLLKKMEQRSIPSSVIDLVSRGLWEENLKSYPVFDLIVIRKAIFKYRLSLFWIYFFIFMWSAISACLVSLSEFLWEKNNFFLFSLTNCTFHMLYYIVSFLLFTSWGKSVRASYQRSWNSSINQQLVIKCFSNLSPRFLTHHCLCLEHLGYMSFQDRLKKKPKYGVQALVVGSHGLVLILSFGLMSKLGLLSENHLQSVFFCLSHFICWFVGSYSLVFLMNKYSTKTSPSAHLLAINSILGIIEVSRYEHFFHEPLFPERSHIKHSKRKVGANMQDSSTLTCAEVTKKRTSILTEISSPLNSPFNNSHCSSEYSLWRFFFGGVATFLHEKDENVFYSGLLFLRFSHASNWRFLWSKHSKTPCRLDVVIYRVQKMESDSKTVLDKKSIRIQSISNVTIVRPLKFNLALMAITGISCGSNTYFNKCKSKLESDLAVNMFLHDALLLRKVLCAANSLPMENEESFQTV